MGVKVKSGLSLVGVVLGLGLLIGFLGSIGEQTDSIPESSVAPSAQQLRAVAVYSTADEPSPSTPGSPIRVKIERGRLPQGQSRGTVVTDENCEPDAEGISHCLNRIRFDGGESIEVRHPHDMSKVACLAPGEEVEVQLA